MFPLINPFTGLGGSLKMIAIFAIVASIIATVAGVFFKLSSMSSQISALQEEKTQLVASNTALQQNVDVLKGNIKTIQDANSANLKTIQALLKERKDAQAALNMLASTQKADRQNLDNLLKQLDSLKQDPKNNGLVAPVLKETIRGIQTGKKK